MRILVTGAAGFIGRAVSEKLLDRGDSVFGVDNFNPYYDIKLKHDRLKTIKQRQGFEFLELDILNKPKLIEVFQRFKPEYVVHLAAQAGVRYSLENPQAYVDSNITGTLNVLECCRSHPVKHLVYASSSSVYGGNKKLPFSVKDPVDHPISMYAATKKANELMAHTYSHLFHIPITGLRFFTVYGPWGRPDMSIFKFTQSILKGEPIEVYNNGKHRRDFTFIDDITDGVIKAMDFPPTEGTKEEINSAACRVYNIGNSAPVWLNEMIETLELELGKKAEKILLPMQQGDVKETYADVSELERDVGFKPATPLKVGINKFVSWYRDYYRL